ncbi:MAG: hypothetical protein N2748_02800 [candidate division WOR-3 bacterium]|nr:hypothetical protein [candidate division WOR-3 bacterium]
MAKYFALIICFLLPALLVAEEAQVEVGNIVATLDVIQGNPQTTLEIIYNANDTEVEVFARRHNQNYPRDTRGSC